MVAQKRTEPIMSLVEPDVKRLITSLAETNGSNLSSYLRKLVLDHLIETNMLTIQQLLKITEG